MRPDGRRSFLPHAVNGNTPHPYGVRRSAESADPGDWTTHSRRTAFDEHGVRVEALDVTGPPGDRFVQGVVHLPATAVALVVREEEVLVLRTYRHPVGLWGYELPGGGVEDAEDPADAAAREAAEETGWRPVGPGRAMISFEPLPGEVVSPAHVVVFETVEPSGEPRDPLEPGRVQWLPLADVPRLAAAGELLGAGTLVGLLQYLAERS